MSAPALAQVKAPGGWQPVGRLDDIPRLGARVVESARGPIAVFRTGDDGVFALRDRCPHRGGPLSQGIVHGQCVTCPLHNWVLDLASGEAQGPDEGAAARFAARVDGGGRIWIDFTDAGTGDGA